MNSVSLHIKAAGIVIVYIILRIITFPIYIANKSDFKKNIKSNPFYKSIYVRSIENHPWFYELTMYINNFPYPTSPYHILPDLKGEVLQIGCGTGLLNKFFKKNNEIHFTNLDINSKYLDYGIKRGRYEQCIYQDICKMINFDKKYDYIVFARCFHHIKNHKKAFEICSHLLKDTGEIIIADPVVLQEKVPKDKKYKNGVYRANSSTDGVIWRFSDKSILEYIKKKLPASLLITETFFDRLPHMTNYNLKYPQTDARITIRKVKET